MRMLTEEELNYVEYAYGMSPEKWHIYKSIDGFTFSPKCPSESDPFQKLLQILCPDINDGK